jgi:hypothetical protein
MSNETSRLLDDNGQTVRYIPHSDSGRSSVSDARVTSGPLASNPEGGQGSNGGGRSNAELATIVSSTTSVLLYNCPLLMEADVVLLMDGMVGAI